jgi:hypothetical protein
MILCHDYTINDAKSFSEMPGEQLVIISGALLLHQHAREASFCRSGHVGDLWVLRFTEEQRGRFSMAPVLGHTHSRIVIIFLFIRLI